MEQPSNFCVQLAEILKGRGVQEGDFCKVVRYRALNASIAGHAVHGLGHMVRFGTPDYEGNTLITGELVLQEGEVSQAVERLSAAGVIVAGVHSRWIYDTPKLIYVTFETYSNPLYIARILTPILDGVR